MSRTLSHPNFPRENTREKSLLSERRVRYHRYACALRTILRMITYLHFITTPNVIRTTRSHLRIPFPTMRRATVTIRASIHLKRPPWTQNRPIRFGLPTCTTVNIKSRPEKCNARGLALTHKTYHLTKHLCNILALTKMTV